MDRLRILEILITSRTPLIAIETLEEEGAVLDELREWARGRAGPAA
jgi:hypothetical protein